MEYASFVNQMYICFTVWGGCNVDEVFTATEHNKPPPPTTRDLYFDEWFDRSVRRTNFQFPIYWFSAPALFKKYMDEVYAYGVFFGMGSESNNSDKPQKYGFSNGLMNGKKYMLSITTNAPEEAYGDPDGFFEGKDLEEFLFNIHKTHQFCGMEPLKSFAANNVIKEPQPEQHIKELEKHLDATIVEPFSVWGSSCNK